MQIFDQASTLGFAVGASSVTLQSKAPTAQHPAVQAILDQKNARADEGLGSEGEGNDTYKDRPHVRLYTCEHQQSVGDMQPAFLREPPCADPPRMLKGGKRTIDHTSAFSLHSVPASTSGAAQSKVLCIDTCVFSLLKIFASPTLHHSLHKPVIPCMK